MAARRGRQSRTDRRAVTLLEVLLVLAVLLLLAAAAWPSLDRSLAEQRLRHAADMIRAEWTRAHILAVSTGVEQRFRIEPDGRRYWIEPADDAAGSSVSESGAIPLQSDWRLLPADVVFGKVTVEAFSPGGEWESLDPVGGDMATGLAGVPSEESVLFFPDGTCSTAGLVLRNPYDRCVTVSLNGLTALATVGGVFPAEEILP